MSRIDGNWLHRPETQAVLSRLNEAGHTALFVGGCVRNALMGVEVSDIDIATDARPEQVQAICANDAMKCVATGIEHGTVTVVSGGIAHEVTTFRKDIETDGRRAVVAYSDNILEDAQRRDFTMNALYADSAGLVIDPLGGLDDLRKRRVIFIQSANQRIKEDYLRILRFFRFHAWYGDEDAGLDTGALAAVADNLDGLESLSKERVGSEMLKLLSAPDPAPSVAAMDSTGVLARVIPGATSRYLAPLVHFEHGEGPDAIRRLAGLGGTDVQGRLRLSRENYKRLTVLRDMLAHDVRGAEAGYRFGKRAAIDGELLRAAFLETAPDIGFRESVSAGATQVFPLAAADLMPEFSGRALGDRLKVLEDRWVQSGFELTRAQLLA